MWEKCLKHKGGEKRLWKSIEELREERRDSGGEISSMRGERLEYHQTYQGGEERG